MWCVCNCSLAIRSTEFIMSELRAGCVYSRTVMMYDYFCIQRWFISLFIWFFVESIRYMLFPSICWFSKHSGSLEILLNTKKNNCYIRTLISSFSLCKKNIVPMKKKWLLSRINCWRQPKQPIYQHYFQSMILFRNVIYIWKSATGDLHRVKIIKCFGATTITIFRNDNRRLIVSCDCFFHRYW